MMNEMIGKNEPNPHGVKLSFGKHRDKLITRVPVSYLKWMINEKTPQYEVAKAEFKRRGDTMPKVELTGHAINNFSLRCLGIWQEWHKDGEGIYSFMERITLEAIAQGAPIGGRVHYKGMKFCIAEGEEFPTLKTIMRNKTLE